MDEELIFHRERAAVAASEGTWVSPHSATLLCSRSIHRCVPVCRLGNSDRSDRRSSTIYAQLPSFISEMTTVLLL